MLMGGGAQITVLDGAGCIGGNKILLSADGCNLMLDFGLNFGEQGRYFDGFIRPRASRGLKDYLDLGLAPAIDIYRPDLATADSAGVPGGRLRLDALFISHAHLDHMGLVGLVDGGVPLLCGQTTAALVKGLKESSVATVGAECGYIVPRLHAEDRMTVEADRRNATGRDLYLPQKPSDEFMEFWQRPPGAKRLEKGDVAGMDSLPFRATIYPVDHSVYGASAIAVETGEGAVVYTGDLRLHGRGKDLTKGFIDRARSLCPRALIIEGTRTGREMDEEVSEEEVRRNCREAVEEEGGLVLADFSSRNFERLDTFLDIASATGRELVVTSADAYNLEALETSEPRGRLDKVRIFDPVQKERGMKVETKNAAEEKVITPSALAASPGQFILCFSLTDMVNLLDIGPEGGTYVYSNSEAFDEGQEIRFGLLAAWLGRFRIRPVGFEMVENGGHILPRFLRGFHASGHASSSDLIEIVRGIGPEIVVPVHTTAPEVFLEIDGVKTIVPERSVPIRL